MLKTRLCAAGIGLLAAATFALAGCNSEAPGEDNNTQPTTSAPQTDAKDAFINAVSKLSEQSVKIEMKMVGLANISANGQSDPVGKKSHFDAEMTIIGTKMDFSMIAIAGEGWAKLNGVPGMPDKWMHLSADKVKAGTILDNMTQGDPAGSKKFGEAVVGAQWDGTDSIKGTIDLTKASISAAVAKQLGDKGKAVPFTATLDADGRLASLTLDMNAVKPGVGKITTMYSGYGEPVEVTKPAEGDVIEMPAQILEAFNK